MLMSCLHCSDSPRGERQVPRFIRKALLLHIFAATLALLVSDEAAARNALTSSQALTFTDGANSIPYRLFEPNGFNTPGSSFPLILFLHGAGERGTNNTAQVTSHIQGLIDRTELGSSAAYLIAPQCPLNQSWLNTPLRLALDLTDQFIATHNVDPTRVYITGLSMGGFGTFEAIVNRPGMFAAAVPMSGGGNPSLANAYAQVPIWSFHGGADTTVPPSSSRNTISAIQNAGGTKERYTELAGQGHVIWAPIYNGNNFAYDTNYTGTYATDGSGDMYTWLFAQQAVPEPTTTVLLLTAAAWIGGRRRRAGPTIGIGS